MARVHLLVEGQTEDVVVRELIAPYLAPNGVFVTHNILITRRTAGASADRGGVSKWRAIERNVRNLLCDPTIDAVTMLFDFYAFPADAPGMPADGIADPHIRVKAVEAQLLAHVADPRFIPFLVLHEIEAWVLSSLRSRADTPQLCAAVTRLLEREGGPELVDGGRETAPSKRLEQLFQAHVRRRYLKTTDGPTALKAHGLDGIRADCPHLDEWLARLIALGS